MALKTHVNMLHERYYDKGDISMLNLCNFI